MFELGVTVRALVAFENLDVRLQALAFLPEEFANYNVTNCVASCLEFVGQVAQTLARPA